MTLQAVDANEDGSIDQSEYALFFEILGLDTAMAPSSFQVLYNATHIISTRLTYKVTP